MASATTYGPMEIKIEESIKKIRSMEKVLIGGLMEGCMMGNGKMAGKMGKDSLGAKMGL